MAAPAAHSLRPFFARAAVDPEPGAPREPHEGFAELGPEVSFDPLSRALRGESALEALAAGGGELDEVYESRKVPTRAGAR